MDKIDCGNQTTKGKYTVPILALGLDIFPFVYFGSSSLLRAVGMNFLTEIPSILIIAILLLPILGIIIGVFQMCLGKDRIGHVGMILARIAVAAPILFVAVMILLVRTGAIAIGM